MWISSSMSHAFPNMITNSNAGLGTLVQGLVFCYVTLLYDHVVISGLVERLGIGEESGTRYRYSLLSGNCSSWANGSFIK
jgi:hypothetical protein